MLIEDVKKLDIYKRLIYWITERESIRLKKESNLPKPWTDDVILQGSRFCNVRRMDDKVSKYLMDTWYRPYKDHKHMIQACALARFFNLPSSLQLIEEFIFTNKPSIEYEEITRVIRKRRDEGYNIFNGAYVVRGNDGNDKVDSVVNYYIKPLAELEIETTYMRRTWVKLNDCFGFGSFMAGQVVADLRWALTGLWLDKNLWACVGPGSARGMARLLTNNYRYEQKASSMKQSDFMHEFIPLMTYLRKNLQLPLPALNRLEAHDFQNCLCEFDKYERVLSGEGRAKQKYKGLK